MSQSERFFGAILGLYGNVIQGWVFDRQIPDARLAVEIYINGEFASLARADQYQPAATLGDLFHGFAVQLPSVWIDEAELITVRIANQGAWLEGSLQFPLSANAGSITVAPSVIWYTGGLRVSGWVWNPLKPGVQAEITAREGDTILAQVIADHPHPAFCEQQEFAYGFSLDLPWELADGEVHTIHIESEQGLPLYGSPITVCYRPEGLEALMRSHWPRSSTQDDATQDQAFELMTLLARDQDQRAPRTVGFVHYARWYALHDALGRQRSHENTVSTDLQIGILLLDDAENDARCERTLSNLAQQSYPVSLGVRVVRSKVIAGIEMLLQQGAKAILPIRAGDHLSAHALIRLVEQLSIQGAAWIYSDCDTDGMDGQRIAPWLKPIWDIDLFMGVDIFSPGALFGKDIVQQALALLPKDEDIHRLGLHGFMAAIALATERHQACVVHLPEVLYHRVSGSVVDPAYAVADSNRHAAITWLARQLSTPDAKVEALHAYPALYQIRRPLPAPLPLISLIIPTRDKFDLLRPCIESVLSITDYPTLELIVVDNDSRCSQTLEYLHTLMKRGIRVLSYPYPFNYAAMNNYAVNLAHGEYIVLLNNDVEVQDPVWLKEMLSHAIRPEIGAVGAKLLWRNHMVQHGGVVVGVNRLAAHTGNNWLEQDPGYLGCNQLVRRQSAVTAACLLLRKQLFQELGGFNEREFAVTFNDVELCLRILQTGRHIIWTPFAKLVHAESASRGKDNQVDSRARARREQQNFMRTWAAYNRIDPYYHPALTHDWSAGPYNGLRAGTPVFEPRLCTVQSLTVRSNNSKSCWT